MDASDHIRDYELVAGKAGRRLETRTGRGLVEVSEVTRTGQTVRTARFMASRVVAVVEHPREDVPRTDSKPRRVALPRAS